MKPDPKKPVLQEPRSFRIVDLNDVSLYIGDDQAAITFYSQVFGAPAVVDESKGICGWRMGATWLTLFRGTARSNPRNAEFAIRVSAREEVDALYQAFIGAGAAACTAPGDTAMCEPMRFGCVDDPFGVRIDIYCPIAG